jgi:hypothetical protein
VADETKLNIADSTAIYVNLVKASNNLHAALAIAQRTPDDPFAVEALRRLNENLETAKADWSERYPPPPPFAA